MPFTEFYCDAGPSGSNLNSGHTEGAAFAVWTSGTWVAATGVFTIGSGGTPASQGVVVGDFASVFADGGTITGFVGRITAFDATTITVSLTAKAGTAPVDGTSNRTLRVGGAWKGPNATVDHPFGFMVATLNDGVNLTPRVNFKRSTNYVITASISHGTAEVNPIVWQGYTTTPGDGGRATLEVTAAVASFVVLTIGSTNCRRMILADLIFKKNGTSGTANGLAFNSTMGMLIRVSAINMRGSGIVLTGAGVVAIECDTTDCNAASTAGVPSITAAGNMRLVRCVAVRSRGPGFGTSVAGGVNMSLIHCIAVSSLEAGLSVRTVVGTSGGSVTATHCDFYLSSHSGVFVDNAVNATAGVFLENCNLLYNQRYGVEHSGSATGLTHIVNCGFGSGDVANVLGDVLTGGATVIEKDNVIYPPDLIPYGNDGLGVDPPELSLVGPARHTGRGVYFPDAIVPSSGYPDIGAVDHLSVGIMSSLRR